MGVYEMLKSLFEEKAAKIEELKDEFAGFEKVFQIAVTDGEPCYIEVKEGTFNVVKGQHENPSLVLTADSAVWEQILKGELDSVAAYMSGQLRIEGSLEDAMKLKSVLDRIATE